MDKNRILVVDDEEIMRSSLRDWLQEDGYTVCTVEDGSKALGLIKKEQWDLAIVDLKMPGIDGLEVLKQTNKIRPNLPVIIITAYATIDTAVIAMKHGAADYIVKPFNPEEISVVIGKLIEHQRLLRENIQLRRELAKRFRFQDLIAKSARMLEVFDLVKIVAPTTSTVLIRGESGTGKELIARAIHELSNRNKGPFIAAACGAMPESLLEAELFGYEKGAFTGANTQRKGRIEMADKGTLFLDEIGDVSSKTQVNLLRFLQERELRRIGGKEPIKVDIRVIAATNKDIESLIDKGVFREDLYYRLNVISIELPPLRERKEDIPFLAEYFIEQCALKFNKAVDGISEPAMRFLIDFQWPGNVRQLENAIEHAVVVTQDRSIKQDDLPQFIYTSKIPDMDRSPEHSLKDIERDYILKVLEAQEWNINKSARILGINRVTLYNKIKKYRLKKE